MKLYFIILTFCLWSKTTYSQKVDISCNVKNETFNNQTLQSCEVDGPLKINRENMQANVIKTYSSLKDLNITTSEGFYVLRKDLRYFPQNLEKSFPKLKAIRIYDSGLKKITNANLKDFPLLEFLDLSFNKLRTLEKNLFSNNIKLNQIWLNNNRIFLIDPTAFDGLKNLNLLSLGNNLCYILQKNLSYEAKNQSIESNCSYIEVKMFEYLFEIDNRIEEFSFFRDMNLQSNGYKNMEKNTQAMNHSIVESLTKWQELVKNFSRSNNKPKQNIQEIMKKINEVPLQTQNVVESAIRSEFEKNLLNLKEANDEIKKIMEKFNNSSPQSPRIIDNIEDKYLLIGFLSTITILLILNSLLIICCKNHPNNEKQIDHQPQNHNEIINHQNNAYSNGPSAPAYNELQYNYEEIHSSQNDENVYKDSQNSEEFYAEPDLSIMNKTENDGECDDKVTYSVAHQSDYY